MKANIERTDKKRIVIVGGGLGGLELAFKLVDDDYQVVLIDKNNYHQFPPFLSVDFSKVKRTFSSEWQR